MLHCGTPFGAFLTVSSFLKVRSRFTDHFVDGQSGSDPKSFSHCKTKIACVMYVGVEIKRTGI